MGTHISAHLNCFVLCVAWQGCTVAQILHVIAYVYCAAWTYWSSFHVRQLLVVDPAERSAHLVLTERDDAWVGGPTTFAGWSPDGASVLYASERTGFCHLYRVAPEGGVAEALTSGPFEVQSVRLLPDDETALLVTNDPQDFAVRQLRLLDLASGGNTVLTGSDGCVAGTGWSGGRRPQVSRDGSTLFFQTTQSMLSVEIDTSGEAPIPQNPVELFSFSSAGVASGYYDVAADGRFVMVQRDVEESGEENVEPATPTIVVIENWFAEFQQR